jgi:hypothetical protein
MSKGLNEKSIRITNKPSKNIGIMPSYSDGQKQSKVPKPKSLTPLKNSSSRKK